MSDDTPDPTKTRYADARIVFQQSSHIALNAEIAFVLTPSPLTTVAYRQAHGGAVAAQVELHEAQYARIMHVSGAGQMAKLIAEELDMRFQVLEEVSVENRDGLKHLTGLIETLIERLESPITGRAISQERSA